jgi:hypothetical protein
MIIFLFPVILSAFIPLASFANPDVYDVLPADIRILQYSLADFDGDAREELAILYTTAPYFTRQRMKHASPFSGGIQGTGQDGGMTTGPSAGRTGKHPDHWKPSIRTVTEVPRSSPTI